MNPFKIIEDYHRWLFNWVDEPGISDTQSGCRATVVIGVWLIETALTIWVMVMSYAKVSHWLFVAELAAPAFYGLYRLVRYAIHAR